MTPYFAAYGIFISLWLVGRLSNKRQISHICNTTIIIFLTLFAAIRGTIGADTAAYRWAFVDFNPSNASSQEWTQFEPMFMATIWTVKLFSSDPQLLIITVALIQGWLLYIATKNQPEAPLILLYYTTIFYLQNHFNIIRAGIATLLIIICHQRLADSKTNIHIFIIACLFHYSALLLLPFVIHKKSKTQTALITASIGIIFVTFAQQSIEGKLDFYYLSWISYFEGGHTISAGFLAILALTIISHYKTHGVRSNRLNALLLTVIILKFAQLYAPILWRVHEMFACLWFATVAAVIYNSKNKVGSYSFYLLCAAGFYTNYYLPIAYDMENRINYEKSTGRTMDHLFESPLVPYKTFIEE